jgi:hypothetical protein
MQLKQFLLLLTIPFVHISAMSQDYSFGKGFRYQNGDTTFQIKAAFRFQSLFLGEWTIKNDDLSKTGDLNTEFLIRRSRLKFDGFALSPNLKYKFELGVANRDISATDTYEFRTASNIIYDAYVDWNFHKGFSLLVGQTKLPGNRERVISSGNLQMVDRSLLNSRFNLDRDMGIQFSHSGKLGKQFIVNQIIAISQGEGRNVAQGNIGGLEYTYRMDALPFGEFASNGDYSGSDLKRESRPKLSIGLTFDINDKAGRNRGNLGTFYRADSLVLKTLYTGFVDMMFKYKGFSMMSEFAIRGTDGNDPTIAYTNGTVAGNYYTGSAFNAQVGYLFKKNYEFSLRYTTLRTQNSIVGKDVTQYFIGFSRYIVDHKLKVQTDFGYDQIAGGDDGLIWRVQMDFHL